MPTGGEIEVDRVDEEGWGDIVQSFDDASLYQTWSWGAVRWGEKNLSHVVLKEGGRTVAAAQAWIIKMPVLDRGIAYVKMGPMWECMSGERRLYNCRFLVRALMDEYAEKRGLLLRIMPNAAAEKSNEVYSMMLEEGFEPSQNPMNYRTLIIDMSSTVEELKVGLNKKWRQNLSGALRVGLTVEEGSSEELFDVAAELYREMHARKKFAEHLDINEVREIHSALPDKIKMRVIVCRYKGRPVSAYITSLVGGMGIDIISGTVSDGLQVHSSYLVHWRMLEWLKSSGCRWYDLGGIDPVNFPGPYCFKAGFAGRNGKDVVFNQFDFSRGYSSKLAVRTADRLNHAYRTIKELAVKLR